MKKIPQCNAGNGRNRSLLITAGLLAVLPLLIGLAGRAEAGSVQFSTYYPAPFGAYDRLRLPPRAALSGICNTGTMYVNLSGEIQYCNSGTWGPISEDVWTKTGDDIYLTDTTPNIFVGIGTAAPEFKLTLDQDGGILAKGQFNTGATLSALSVGEYLIWYPRKASFRVGSVTGTQWDDINIGDYSTVTGGRNNTASGAYSVVGGGIGNTASATHAAVTGGEGNTASGNYSTVSGGDSNQATGPYSVVTGGWDNQATATHAAVSGGGHNRATGNFSVVSGGLSNRAEGNHSVVSGGGAGPCTTGGAPNVASGNFAVVTGGACNTAGGTHAVVTGGAGNTASGDYSVISGGNRNTASNQYASVTGGEGNIAGGVAAHVSGGVSNEASGDFAAVPGGWSNRAAGYGSVAWGENNYADGDYSLAGGRLMRVDPAADRAFIWGYYLGMTPPTVTQPDAFIIYSGNVGIGTTNPTVKLDINGNLRVDLLTDFPAGTPTRYDPAGSRTIGLDLAERFETAEEVEAGDIVTLDETGNHKHWKSRAPYDPKGIGVVSAAPAILFQGNELEIAPVPGSFTKGTNPPVALTGRVLCKVTTESGPIKPGDILTSSSTPGHAMKAVDPEKSYGAIIGKALEAFPEDSEAVKTGTIMILVM